MLNARLSAARVAAALAVPLLAAGSTGIGPALAAGHNTLFVSPKGSDANSCTANAPCLTISHAISLATAGDTVRVQQGTYHEQVTISTSLSLQANGSVTIDATGLTNGVLIKGAAAAASSVQGFTVQHATFEGVLAMNTSGLDIEHNVVTHNDLGTALPPSQQTGECQAVGPIPGDCGEGLHLWSVTDSHVEHNVVNSNAGGILLTDETGPTSGNVISHNTVDNNSADCGITIASHNTQAAPGGLPNPSKGGIYDNVISQNEANGNGLAGQGAGILLAGGPPGTAVYNNVVDHNVARGNGLAGVTLHSHAPFQDLRGNVITHNTISNDNLDGDFDFFPSVDPKPTGIIIASATPLSGTIIQGNDISDVYYGIWTLNVPTIPVTANHFASDVAVPVSQQP